MFSLALSRFPPIFVIVSRPQIKVVEVFDAGEGALRFTFHTPFTAAGKVHGSTAEQCKKLTELEVRRKEGGLHVGRLASFVRLCLYFRLIVSLLLMCLFCSCEESLFVGDYRITWCVYGQAPSQTVA